DATAFHRDRDRFGADYGWDGAATLWQRNFFVDGGWRLDNGLGVINTPSVPLQREQYRFYLPTAPLAGVSTTWSQDQRGLTLYGAAGRAGVYDGTRLVGFEMADGESAALGAQWRWTPTWTGAIGYLGASGRVTPDDRGELVITEGTTQATHWQGRQSTIQFNALASRGDDGDAFGAWIDGSTRRGRYSHHYGVFWLDPDLAWGALPINHDARGGYYRLAYQYARWNWNIGLDDIRSISEEGFDGQYATGFVRYQATSQLGYGGSLHVRHTPDVTFAVQLFADRTTRWGVTRWQWDEADGQGDAPRSWLASVDHAFDLHQGARLSAALAHGALSYDHQSPTTTTTLSLYGGADLGDPFTVDGTVRWTQGNGPSAVRGWDLNLSLNWRLNAQWSMALALFQSQAAQCSPFVLDPLATQTSFVSLPRDRSAFLTLRYDRHAGRPTPVLGGAPGVAAGSVSGWIYLDENGDGMRAAAEQPVSNITVILDGRYAIRTDSNGRFVFLRVAAGLHQIQVEPDNLPLPWVIREEAAQRAVRVH
ncbi:MAG TPA: hypothetical protein VGQ93_13450, partial [Lysobacter sp.]|nr:hypothetical protein [Lysobacter sp.]